MADTISGIMGPASLLSDTAHASAAAQHAGAVAQFAAATKNVVSGFGDGMLLQNQPHAALMISQPLDLVQSKGWTEHQTNEGRKYYYHAETERSSWSLPDEIQSREQKILEEKTPWREYRIWDGRKFFHNEDTKVSCWVAPSEVIAAYENADGHAPSASVEMPIPKSRREKIRMYMDLLVESKVDALWTFSQAETFYQDDPRASLIPLARRRQSFVEHVMFTQKKRQVEEQSLRLSAKEHFLRELLEWPELELTTTYAQICNSQLQSRSVVWKYLTNAQRREVFNDALSQFAEKHRMKLRKDTIEAVPELQMKFVSHPNIRPSLRWEEVKFILRQDDAFNRLEPLEALRVWKAYQMLDILPEEENVSQQKYRDGRKMRDKFVSLLDDLRANGKTGIAYEEMFPMIKDLEEFTTLEECEKGSSAEALYHFYEMEHQRKRPRFDVEA